MWRKILRSALAVFVLAYSFVSITAPAEAQAGLPAWGVVPSPNAGIGAGNTLTAVAVLSGSDIWAVGSWDFSIFIQPQVQHWNGATWTTVPLPPEVPEAELFGIAAVAPDDVWFVGGYNSGGDALILHWDGAVLSVVAHPKPGIFNRLYAVTAIAANDVWAVGEYANGGVSVSLTLHWDGAAWTHINSPTVANAYTQLNGVSGSASNDVWAVGQAGTRTFTMRWNGTQWRRVNSPTPGGSANFAAVTALASNDAWAVGDASNTLLTAHWDGTRWNRVRTPDPNPSGFFKQLFGVTALAANDVWAVGLYSDGPKWNTLVLHWNGANWQIVTSPSPDPSLNQLNAVDATGAAEVWAVGRGSGTLVERWDGAAWTTVPSANQGTADNDLLGLSLISAADIWAVGVAGGESLTEHWDGAAWSVVASPNAEFGTELHDVDGLAAGDVWAVGHTGSSAGIDYDTVTLHWDGAAWNTIASPNGNPTGYNDLDAVAMVAANDVWAVGEFWGDFGTVNPLILHWDGTAWSLVADNCGPSGSLDGITVISPTDIWAVGSGLTCYYDGAAWNLVPSPQPRPAFSEISYSLLDVDAVASDDIWAVGTRALQIGENIFIEPLAEHWDGASWTAFYDVATGTGVLALASDDVYAVGPGIFHWDGAAWETVASPLVGTYSNLNDIAAAAPDDLWAAGFYYTDTSTKQTLIERAPSSTQGNVTGNTGYSGALVTYTGPVLGTVEADIFGNFIAAGLPVGTYTFIAAAPFCTPAIATVEVLPGISVVQDLLVDC